MFKSPRFVVQGKILASSFEALSYDSSFFSDVQRSNGNLSKKNKLELMDLTYDNYALLQNEVREDDIAFINKIYKSIKRNDVKILDKKSENEALKLKISDNLNQVSILPLEAYQNQLRSLDSLQRAVVLLNFSNQTHSTFAQILKTDDQSNALICLTTYDLTEILTNTIKKSEFWAFLKLLKA